MRRNNKNFIAVVLGAFLLLLGACAESDLTADDPSVGLDENGLATVSIDVSIENTLGGTRADGYDYTKDPTQSGTYISTGQRINALIYAVYKMNITSAGTTFALVEYFRDSTKTVDGITAGKGQTVDQFSAKETKHISMKVDPELSYRIVFWAQDAQCKAYTTTDLEEITISYANASNNDESRDAFCGWVDLSAGKTNKTAKAVLRRPFAQINVGTTGADYKNLIYDPNLRPNGITITQSTMTVTGVADKYNALTGEAEGRTGLKAQFEYSWLPAWINIQPTTEGDCPIQFNGNYTKDDNPFVDNSAASEEFLKVKLNNDGTLLKYKTEYPTLDDNKNFLTETFKYMSMCYVLAPSSTNSQGSSVTVSYTLHQKKSNNESTETPIPLAEKILNNVPVKANWRTNILHGLYGEGDDPTSIFSGVTMPVILQTNFDYHYVRYTTDQDPSTEEKKDEND